MAKQLTYIEVKMKRSRKIPIQVYLEPDQDQLLRRLSKHKGMSRAAIIRSCISQYIESLPVSDDPAWGLVGLGDSGKGDMAENHDDYLTSFTK